MAASFLERTVEDKRPRQGEVEIDDSRRIRGPATVRVSVIPTASASTPPRAGEDEPVQIVGGGTRRAWMNARC